MTQLVKRIEDLYTFYNCAMAVMYESIILCVIGIVIHTSAAFNIYTHICLGTAVRFIDGRYKCQFRSDYAASALKDVATCTNKCNVQMVYLQNQYTYYYLREVHVTIGTEQTFMQSICQPSHTRYEPMDMYITCSSWNKDKYRVNVMNTTSCRLRNAQCERIGNYCICHRFREYIVVNGSCLKGNVTVGHYCSYQQQCTGTEFASVCNNRRCDCQTGYILIRNNCYQGKVTIGKWCVFDVQCTGTQLASLCQNGLCSCRSGFVAYHNNCVPAKNVTVGHSCLYDRQCTGTQFASVCDHYRCECQPGYILIDNNCYPELVTVGHYCSYNQQCTGTEYASVCNNGLCECQSGYILNRNNCYQDNNIGKILGTLFGGILIGVILTAVVAFLMFKKMQTKIKMREEPSVSFANDAVYSSAIVVEREDITGSQANAKEQKVVNVLPYACSEKGAVYSFVKGKPTTEGVYNHLREEEKHDYEHDDNYDHACAASYLGTEPSVYSNMP
ncbi:prion-like-(Q/N-rich) domain-bearing protein 25 [Crassostrea angulata]|uniref:prion-like-(Q/N-rich) domain-bearing protein 25 n=1 Tax=Magallana angulata TaxID=2784310 RepID=UPI0022B0A9DB|nr:prion-like-(Q/N-rich) domain-bearing protein 25 [Crassostrea angulata]